MHIYVNNNNNNNRKYTAVLRRGITAARLSTYSLLWYWHSDLSDTSNGPKRLFREGINVVVATGIRLKRVGRWL
jgi:hypothetical protein